MANDKVQRVAVGILATSGEEGDGTIMVVPWSSSVRLQAAVKVSGALLLAAIGAVFLPGLHFVLVPLLLLAAVVGGIYRFTRGETVSADSLNCPVCSQKLSYEQDNPSWPLALQCSACGAQMTVARTN